MDGECANELTVVPVLLDVVSAGVERLRAGTAEEEGKTESPLVTIFTSFIYGRRAKRKGSIGGDLRARKQLEMAHLMAGDTIQARIAPQTLGGDANEASLAVLVHRQPRELAGRHVGVLGLLLLLERLDGDNRHGVEEIPLVVGLDKDGAVRVQGMLDGLVEPAAFEEGEDGVDAELDDERSGVFGLNREQRGRRR